jgi:hypothetical protein
MAVLTLVAVVLLGISGCSAGHDSPIAPAHPPTAGPESAPASGPAAAPPPASPAAGAPIDRFVAAAQQQLPTVVMDRRDEEVAEIGKLACESLAAGRTPAAIVGEISDYGVSATDARQLLTLAANTACPA